jgi:hypothetical protein
LEGVTKLRDLHPTLILGERSCGLQSLAELVGALSELNRRLGVKYDAALLRVSAVNSSRSRLDAVSSVTSDAMQTALAAGAAW